MRKNIIILHGWQSKIERWEEFKKKLSKEFRVYLPLMPGFGENKLPQPLSLDDYINWLESFLELHKIDNPIIVGHSFGGQLAIQYAAQKGEIDRLILIAAAAIRPGWNIKKLFAFFLAKLGKLFFVLPPFSFFKKPVRWIFYTLLREKDYYRADDNLKKTMRNVLRADLQRQLSKMEVPTLILWGDSDKSTPISNAHLMEKKIPQAKLVVWKGVGHSLPFEKANEVVDLIIEFCKK